MCESIRNAVCGTVCDLIGALCVVLCVNIPETLCVVQCVSLFEILCVTLCVSLSLLRNLLVTLGNLDFLCQKAFHILH